MKERDVRVRYAPSPTGHLHIGGARTALFNYLFAKKHGGKFIIRIEDTDQKRHVDNAEQSQLDNLKWLGIHWDESVDIDGGYGPYRSMERLHLYKPYVEQLLEQGDAYPCFCTEEELEAERQLQMDQGEMPRYSQKCLHLSREEVQQRKDAGIPYAIRFKVPQNQKLTVDDLIRGRVVFDSDGIGDFVIIKKDGIPTYNYAVTIDDALMEISHVIRGEEHLSNTPRQLMIYNALKFDAPYFGHLPLILNQDRQKMSKRDESIIQFVEQYRDLGYLPVAINNFLVLLGWSPEGEEEIFSLTELEKLFDIKRVSKSPAVFDMNKLAWMNNVYIKAASLEEVVELCLPHLEQAGFIQLPLSEEQSVWTNALIALFKDKLDHGAEIVQLVDLFYKEDIDYDEEAKDVLAGEQVPAVLSTLKARLESLEDYTAAEIKNCLKEVQKETGYKGKSLFMPIRVATTGQVHGPDLDQSLYLLGKERVIKRLDQFL